MEENHVAVSAGANGGGVAPRWMVCTLCQKLPKTYAATTGLQNAQEKVSNSLHAEKYRAKED